MIRKFVKYYKPHRTLFLIDMLVATIASALAIAVPYLTRDLLKEHIPNRNTSMILQIIALMVLIYSVKALMTYVRVTWGHILGVRMEYDMRADIFRHLQKLSFSYFDNVKTGHIMSRISNDLNYIAEIAHHAPEDVLISFLVIIGALIFMTFFNATLALITFIPLPFMLLWGWFYGNRMRRGFSLVRKKIAEINSTVENSVQGIREVKSFANEKREISKFDSANSIYKIAHEKVYGMLGLFSSGINFIRDIYYLIIITGGTWLIYQSQIEVADLLVFILFVGVILTPLDRLINFIEYFQQGAAAFERFTEIMDIEPDIEDRKNSYCVETVLGEISIDQVSFRYTTSTDWIIHDVSLHISPGEKIAFVGESGAGKSTIVSLIPRFYEPQKGIISIDGHNIMDLEQQFLREHIGLVQQNSFLFDDTIGENIKYGNYTASEEEVIEAAKNAHIYNFIQSLPQGFNTEVGEHGIKLSGGQKQRISIARVFLKNPPILIFDEATSSLDSESESLIQDTMNTLSKNRTTIVIAHRLSTVQNVDIIYVMKEGTFIEKGNHSELLTKKGYYYSLYSKNLF